MLSKWKYMYIKHSLYFPKIVFVSKTVENIQIMVVLQIMNL